MAIRAITFDLEGTLVDLERYHHEAHLYAAQQLLGKVVSVEQALLGIPHFIGGPDEAVAQDFWRIYGTEGMEPDIESFCVLKRQKYEELRNTNPAKLRLGVREVIQEFKSMGLLLAIGSLTDRESVLRIASESGLEELIPPAMYVCREDVLNLKPAPDVFCATAERLEVETCNQLVFEDSPRGVTAAISAGSSVIAVPVFHDDVTLGNLKSAGAEKIYTSWLDVGRDVSKIVE